MQTSRQSGQPRREPGLRGLARRYAPDWLKNAYRSYRDKTRSENGNGVAPMEWSAAATSVGWKVDAAAKRFLRQAELAAAAGRRDRIAVFTDTATDDDTDRLGGLLRTVSPASTVLQFVPSDQDQQVTRDQAARLIEVAGGNASDTHALLTAHGPYDLIIDATAQPVADRLRRFRHSWFHLVRGGRYCLRAVDAELSTDTKSETVWQYVTRLIDDRDRGRHTDTASDDKYGGPEKEERAIAESVRQVRYERGTVTITSARSALPKLREWETERVLEARPEIGSVVLKKPPQRFTRNGAVRFNIERDDKRFGEEYRVPELQLREYSDVLCCPHQVVISHDIVLPDTFRHLTHPRLHSRFLDDLNPQFSRYPRDASAPKELAGTYFYLSSEWPRHFGHVMTEQLSRMWAWSIAKERYPDLKALLPLPGGHKELSGFERAVLGAAGAEEFVSPKGALRVERLLSATPMLVNPSYVHPELPEVWRRAGANLIAQAPQADWPKRVFISRRSNYKRACHNLAEVEEFVTRHGYTVLYPEDYSVAEQALIFESAECLVGFAGSAMFNLMFCTEPKPVILISSESYTARNEYMIAFALGHRLTMIWCDPDIAQPDGGWDGKAFASGFRVDFERDGEFLAEALTADW